MSERDQLDAAIDRVATRLVSVEPDESMPDRIASILPDFSGRRLKPSPSNWVGLAPQFAAAIGVALLAFFLFSNRSTKVAAPPPPIVATVRVPIAEAPPVVMPVTPPTIAARKAPAITHVDNTFDRDYGLPPVAAPQEIAVSTINVPSAEVAPIVLTDLPLASDSPSPR